MPRAQEVGDLLETRSPHHGPDVESKSKEKRGARGRAVP